MRITRDALDLEQTNWIVSDRACETLDWHDHLLAAGVVPVIPYNPENTHKPKDIECRVEDQIKETPKTYD